MRKKHNKEQQYTHLQLSNTLFQVLFFNFYLNDWFDLDLNKINSESISIFKRRFFSFICPVQTNIYNIFDPKYFLPKRFDISNSPEIRSQLQ